MARMDNECRVHADKSRGIHHHYHKSSHILVGQNISYFHALRAADVGTRNIVDLHKP